MIVGIHQLHYFPWTGYLNKMARVDSFVVLDDVQLNDNSYMFRHKLLLKTGREQYITLPVKKEGYFSKKYSELLLNTDVPWQTRHRNLIFDSYKKHPYFNEVWGEIEPIFAKGYTRLSEVTLDTLTILRSIFDINTPLIYQHQLTLGDQRKSELVLAICLDVGAHIYLSGNGAKKYLDGLDFENHGVIVRYQDYIQPRYPQQNSVEFVPGLCSLDMLFNCGISESRKVFWEDVKSGR